VILLLLGLLGFAMRRYGLPVLPLVIGLILGPRAEESLRTTLQLSAGNISGLWSEPVAVVVYIIVALVLLAPLALKVIRKRRPDSVLAGNIALAADETVATNDDGGVAKGETSRDNDKGRVLPERLGDSGGDPVQSAGRHRSDEIQNERERS
jgi:putative tricarboxylic transport membrane protein